MKEQQDSFQLKADFVPLTVIKMVENNIESFKSKWKKTIEQAPQYFTHAPVIIDVNEIAKTEKLDIKTLCSVLKETQIIPVGIKGLSKTQHATAIEQGLAILKSDTKSTAKEKKAAQKPVSSMLITKPVRAGSQIYAKDADLVILSSVNPGAEVIADGNIHIYGPLRGRALAGAMGNDDARIFCESCEAELISIAGHYLVKDKIKVPKTKKPLIHISLKNDQINIEGI